MAKCIVKKKKNGYRMPEPLPLGEILQDTSKQQWVLGSSIGKGGFGEIYSAQKIDSNQKVFPYVIKIEPHENGPLFVEKHFYMRTGKEEDVKAFCSKHNLKFLGMPLYLGSGSHEYNGCKYRFLVMQKFGENIDTILKNFKGAFSTEIVFKLAIQLTYVIEYIHQNGYIHADIKGANILMGNNSDNKHQAYLVDFGLATKFTTNKQYKPDPKKAHNGTIEYLSRDAHKGVPTRRSDLEILAYNIIQWLGGELPWCDVLKNPVAVQNKKEEFFENLSDSVSKAFNKNTFPEEILDFLIYIKKQSFNDNPDYEKIRKIFQKSLKTSNLDLIFDKFVTKRKNVNKLNTLDNEKRPKLDKNNTANKKKVIKSKILKDEIENKNEIDSLDNVNNNIEILPPAMKQILEKKKRNKIKNRKLVDFDNAEMVEVQNKIKKKTDKSKEMVNEQPLRNLRHLSTINYRE